MVNQVQTLHH